MLSTKKILRSQYTKGHVNNYEANNDGFFFIFVVCIGIPHRNVFDNMTFSNSISSYWAIWILARTVLGKHSVFEKIVRHHMFYTVPVVFRRTVRSFETFPVD